MKKVQILRKSTTSQ